MVMKPHFKENKMKLIKFLLSLVLTFNCAAIQSQPQPGIRNFPPVMDRMRNVQILYHNVDSVGMDTTIHTFNYAVTHKAFIGLTKVDTLIWTFTDKGVNDYGDIIVELLPDIPRRSDVSGKHGNISYRWMTFVLPYTGVIIMSFGKGKRFQ